MSAIYQQARPVTFEQVVGQEHVKDVLQAALERGCIGHAYLFSGPRGVGKTTTARLVAMAVNCLSEGAKPCGECESCLLVRRNAHPDVIELDAASNNSVDDIRDLREKVRLSSIRGGKRVWVLDEAHMLSKSASNALLKTLEEPPPNLVFVLATTEPEKLPPTILSRCQHFRFRRLSEAEIAGKLTGLCEKAGVEAETEALALVSRAADGAMRDAESLLERLLASGKPITRPDAEVALGLPPQERLQALARCLTLRELNGMLTEAGKLYRDGFSPRTLTERLKLTLRDALYTAVGLEDGFKLALAEPDLLRVIHALDDEEERFVRRDDLFSLEVALIKALNALAYNVPSEAVVDVTQLHTQTLPTQSAPPERPARTAPALPDFDPNGRNTPAPPPRPAASPPQSPPPPSVATAAAPAPRGSWRDVLNRANAQLKAFMMPAQGDIEGTTLTVHYPDTHKFHYEQIKKREDELEKLVIEVLGAGFTVYVEMEGQSGSRKKP